MDWLFNVETNMELSSIPENLKIAVVSSHCRGLALQIAKRYLQARNTNWAQFREEMIKTFKPVDFERQTRTRLINLRQTGGFESYSREFQLLSNQLPDISNEEKYTCFLQGLRPKTQMELTVRGVKELDQAIVVASQIESTLGNFATASVNYSDNY